MYYRKRRSSALIRIILGICLVVGVFWLMRSPGTVFNFPFDVKVESGNVLGALFVKVKETAKEQAERVGERVGENFQFSIFNFQFKKKEESEKVSFRFAIVADSHEDWAHFPQILERIKENNVDFLIHLGDLVNAGEVEKLKQAKAFLDNTGISYFVIPGDHDFNWQPEHSLANFKEVFGSKQIYSTFEHKGAFFIFLDNSDNSEEVDVGQMKWLKEQLSTINNLPAEALAKAGQPLTINKVFIFCHKPIFYPYFLGKVDPNGDATLALLAEYKVDQVFSGNVHTFARYPDSQTGIGISTIGAAGDYKNPLPQYALVTVFEDGSFDVEAKPYKELKIVN